MRTALLWIATLGYAVAQPVTFEQGTGKVHVRIGGKPFTTMYYSEEYAKPFLQPIFAANGVEITRAFPLSRREGEHSDHPHHRGLWWGHGDINGVDFWLEKDVAKTGRLVANGKPRFGKRDIAIDLDMVQPNGDRIGSVTQTYAFSGRGNSLFIDVSITIHADRNRDLKFGDTEEGTMSLRLRDEFREDRGTTLLNSAGFVGTEKIWGKRATWVDYSTAVEGKRVGVAVLDHPANPKHPTYWHARPYGLLAANPFGEHDFSHDNAQDGSLVIGVGKTLTFRYRYLIHAGDAKDGGVEAQYKLYEKN